MGLRYHRGSRPGKRTTRVFRAIFQPDVPVPDSPPLLLEMFRSPRYSSFIAASSDGKCPRVLVIFRNWKLIDSIAFVTGMKDHGAAGLVDLIFAGGAGC